MLARHKTCTPVAAKPGQIRFSTKQSYSRDVSSAPSGPPSFGNNTPKTPGKLRQRVKKIHQETPLGTTRRARRIHRALAELYPEAHCELTHEDPFQLLVATVLSAQTTDVRVNAVTPALFGEYPDAHTLAQADLERVEQLIHSTGFYRAKAKSIVGLATALVTEFNGEVPGNLESLITLPGVGRKTANVVLGNAFGVPGLTIDTHFGRIARRLGWTDSEDPNQVERDVAGLFVRRDWTELSHRIIFHGRRVCHSRKPACGACPISYDCPAQLMGELDPVKAERLVKPATEAQRVAAREAANHAGKR